MNGVKPPSEIAQALAEQQVDTDSSSAEPSGFVGKYLKK